MMQACKTCGVPFDRFDKHLSCSPCRRANRPMRDRVCGCGKEFKSKDQAKCRVCKFGGPAGRAAYKRIERRRKAAREGRVVRAPLNDIVRAERKRARLLCSLLRQIDMRLNAESRASDAKRWGISESSVSYRRRYEGDPVFRERERLRTRDQKLKVSGAKAAASDGSLTPKALVSLFAKAKRCAYCNKRMASRDKSLDHITPLSRGGMHSVLNAVVCCKRCNSRKHARHVRVMLSGGDQLPLIGAA